MNFAYKKSGTVFNMHTYWTKQPVEPIKFFIEKFSKENDLVYDPFAGTGMTGVASIEVNRRCVLNDLSTIAVHIARGYCTDFKIRKNAAELEEIKKQLLKGMDQHYTTKCNNCGRNATIRFSIVSEIWQDKNGIEEDRGKIMLNNEKTKFKKDSFFKEFRLIKICFDCDCSKEKKYKIPDKNDIKKWKNKNYVHYFFPKDILFGQEPKRNYKKGIKKVYQLYSGRNLTCLSILFDRINQLKDADTRQLFLFIFTSILFNSSLLSIYRNYENTAIKMGTFYISPVIKDTNVVHNFENKTNVIFKGNASIFGKNYKHKVRFLNTDAANVKVIKSNSVDYVYTDPPYSDIINYSELNIVFESWLDKKTDIGKEMIVNKACGKNIETYSSQFEKSLKEIKRVLKNGRFLTLVFHHPNIDHWRYIQKAIINAKLKPIVEKVPIRLISNSKTSSQHKTQKNTQCFLVFNFKKETNFGGLKIKKFKGDLDFISYINKLKEQAQKNGFKNKSDIFDFIINHLLFRYELRDFTNLI